MATNYANITQAATKGKDGGYKSDMYMSPVEDIDVWGRPLAVPLVLGDEFKITTAHEWVDGKAAVKIEAKLHGVKITSETVGDPGSTQWKHTAECMFLGDDPVLFATLSKMLNDKKVIWVKDADCINNDSYVQLGDDCEPVEVTGSFDSATTSEGMKTWTIQLASKKKFFYHAAMDVTA